MSSPVFFDRTVYRELLNDGFPFTANRMLLDHFLGHVKAEYDALHNIQHSSPTLLHSPRPVPRPLIPDAQRLMDIAAAREKVAIVNHTCVQVHSPRPRPVAQTLATVTDAMLLELIVREREARAAIENVRSVSPIVFSSPRPVRLIDLESWEDTVVKVEPEPVFKPFDHAIQLTVPGLDLNFLADDEEESDPDFDSGVDSGVYSGFECSSDFDFGSESDLDDDNEDKPFERTGTYRRISANLTSLISDDDD